MPKWKTIKTAPRDGTKVLLCQAWDADGDPIGGRAAGIFVQVAALWRDGPRDPGAWFVYCDLPNDPRLHFEPTHWMELPAMPDVGPLPAVDD